MRRSHPLWHIACAALSLGAPLWAGEAEWEAELRKKLEKGIKAGFVDTPLPGILRYLANETRCTIALDRSVREDSTVTFRTRGMPAARLLSWVCFLTDSTWLLQDEMIVICSQQKAASLVEKREQTHELGKVAADPADAKAIKEAAERVLGCVGTGSVELAGGRRLTVSASEAGMASVAKLLDSLSRVPRNGKVVWQLPKPDVPPPIEIITKAENWPAGIKRAMEKKVTFDFVETPLPDIANFLSSLVEVPIVLDAAVTREVMRDGVLVTLRVKDMRFEEAFDWVLKLVACRSSVTRQAEILVSKPERVAHLEDQTAPLALAVYDVSDILAEGWQLSEVVGSLREPEGQPRIFAHGFWGLAGADGADVPDGGEFDGEFGPRGEEGEHAPAFPLGVGSRVVAVVKAERESELEAQIKAMRAPRAAPARPDPTKPSPHQPEWVTRIRAALNKKVSFDFTERPIGDVANTLADLCKVTIVLDTSAARRAPNVTLRVKEMRLVAALRWVMQLARLQYAIKEEAIFISEPREGAFGDTVKRPLCAWGAASRPQDARGLAAFLDEFLKALPGAPPWTGCNVRPGYYLDLVAREEHANVAEGVVGWLAHSKPGECHDLWETPGMVPPRDWGAKIREAMKKRITFDFKKTFIQDAANTLTALADLPIVVDLEATTEPLLDVTLRGKEMSLQTALESAFKPLGLTHVLVDEAILVTSPGRALEARPAVWRFYDLRHLAKSRLAATDLALAIGRACRKHHEWTESHQIAEFQNRLVIRATPAVHDAVQKIVEESLKSAPGP